MLSDLEPDELSRAVSLVFDTYKDQVYTYTRNLISDLKKQDYLLFAISGSNTEIVGQIADYYGFDDYVATVFEQKAGHFTGKVQLARYNKHLAVEKLAAKHNATYKGSVGVGDSHGDASFLEVVDQPIAFNPDAELFNHARKKGWKVVLERKNVIYELESKHGVYKLTS
jgi:HAD superfamily phosphoserine phosphatase-like hydrolase